MNKTSATVMNLRRAGRGINTIHESEIVEAERDSGILRLDIQHKLWLVTGIDLLIPSKKRIWKPSYREVRTNTQVTGTRDILYIYTVIKHPSLIWSITTLSLSEDPNII